MRSLLYVPANAEKFIAKAHERGADGVILDLEDSVLPDAKILARAGLAGAAAHVGQAGAKVLVRINSERGLMLDDAAAACRAGADYLIVPKVQAAAALAEIAGHLEPIEAELGREPVAFIGLIEDAGAVLDAREIARGPRLFGLMAGGEDLALSMGAQPTPEVLRLPKLLVHYAAKSAGLMSFGLLRSIADYSDLDGIGAAAAEARAFGFDGASCVHPTIVPVLNRHFSASDDEIAWARRVIEAAKAAGRGAFALDGKMIDLPVIARARKILGVL